MNVLVGTLRRFVASTKQQSSEVVTKVVIISSNQKSDLGPTTAVTQLTLLIIAKQPLLPEPFRQALKTSLIVLKVHGYWWIF